MWHIISKLSDFETATHFLVLSENTWGTLRITSKNVVSGTSQKVRKNLHSEHFTSSSLAGDAAVFLEAGSAFLEVKVFTVTNPLALPELRGQPQPLLSRGSRGGISDLDGGGIQDLDEPPEFGTGLLAVERTDEK